MFSHVKIHTRPYTHSRTHTRTLQFQYDLKGISFLPRLDAGAYPQMPYQEISEQQYHEVCAYVCVWRAVPNVHRNPGV